MMRVRLSLFMSEMGIDEFYEEMEKCEYFERMMEWGLLSDVSVIIKCE